ncbi:hypothetical protein BGI50_17045 [Burkholderia pseudomallei]|nr:hypothetical protein BGI50_17045 [Burkholderia pseudomallei]OMO13982.1 hypothetical protein BGI48_17090 [Burkholderia pseudomallei]
MLRVLQSRGAGVAARVSRVMRARCAASERSRRAHRAARAPGDAKPPGSCARVGPVRARAGPGPDSCRFPRHPERC